MVGIGGWILGDLKSFSSNISMKLLNQGSCTLIPFSSVATRPKSSAQKIAEAQHEKEMNNLIQPHVHRPSGEIPHLSLHLYPFFSCGLWVSFSYFCPGCTNLAGVNTACCSTAAVWKGIPSEADLPAGHMAAEWHGSCLTTDDRHLSLDDTPAH